MCKIFLKFWLLFVLLTVAGCMSNGYSKFYTDFTHKYADFHTDKYVRLQPGQEPQVLAGTELEADSFSMQTSGYVPIGYSSFKGRPVDIELAAKQARKVGAAIVLIYSPLLEKHPSIAKYIPVEPDLSKQGFSDQNSYASFQRSSNIQAASYWVKRTQWGLGAYIEEVPAELSNKIGLREGCYLAIVVKETVAEQAGLKVGDIIVQYQGQEVSGMKSFQQMIQDDGVDKAALKIYRDGNYLVKNVDFQKKPERLSAQK